MAAEKEVKNAALSAQEARAKNLTIALGQIEKEYGKGTIMRLGDTSTIDVPVISIVKPQGRCPLFVME